MATAGKTVAPARSRGRRALWLTIAVVAAAAAAWLGWDALARHRVVMAALPARPDISALPGELEDRVTAAEQRARGWRNPAAGLAELSRLYHANGFYPPALQCYAGLRQLDPKEARWWHLPAGILAGFGRLDEALVLWQHAAELAPNYLPAHLRQADALLKMNRATEAARLYQAVLATTPGEPYALLGLARCDLIGGNWEKARERLNAAIAAHPDFVGGLSLLVTVHEHFGDTAKANALKEAMAAREFIDLPDPWFDELTDDCYDAYRLSVTAAMAGAAGDRPAAVRWLERAVAYAPRSGAYRRQLAGVMAQGGDRQGPRQQLEQAVKLSPNDADAWLLLVQTLNALGDARAAERALANGLANCPSSPSLHFENARRLKGLGENEAAIAEFRVAYRLRPSDAAPLVELATISFSIGRNDEAIAALHEALEKQPEHPMALVTLTYYAISMGDESSARSWWARVQRQPKTPPALVTSLRGAYQQQFGHAP